MFEQNYLVYISINMQSIHSPTKKYIYYVMEEQIPVWWSLQSSILLWKEEGNISCNWSFSLSQLIYVPFWPHSCLFGSLFCNCEQLFGNGEWAFVMQFLMKNSFHILTQHINEISWNGIDRIYFVKIFVRHKLLIAFLIDVTIFTFFIKPIEQTNGWSAVGCFLNILSFQNEYIHIMTGKILFPHKSTIYYFLGLSFHLLNRCFVSNTTWI